MPPPSLESSEQKRQKEPVGPIVGTVIIIVLMLAGAVYFWYERQNTRVNAAPYIPADSSTTTGE